MRRKCTRKHKDKPRNNKTIRNRIDGGTTNVEISTHKSFMQPTKLVYKLAVKPEFTWSEILYEIDDHIRGLGITTYLNRNHHKSRVIRNIRVNEYTKTIK